MQIKFVDLIKPEHFLFQLDAKNAKAAIEMLAELLQNTNHVLPEFAEDVWQREQTFPTGLPTQPVGIAIPHADPDHVNQSAVAIGILKDPVNFFQMGMDNSIMIPAKLVFLLAIKEKEKQVEMLQQLMSLIQSPDLLLKLSILQSGKEAIKLIQEHK